MKQLLLRFRLWAGRRVLRGTGHVAVPVADVKEMDRLCGELMDYALHSGALNDPHKTHARKRVGHLTEAMLSHVLNLTEVL